MTILKQNPTKKRYQGSGANPIKGTIETIPNYPSKLVIFKVESSPFYWCRVYVNGRYTVRSLKTESRKEAQKGAIDLFTNVLVNNKIGRGKPLKSRTFTNVGHAYIETLNGSGKPRRYQDDKNRFSKELVPHFNEKDVGEITNADIGELIKKLEQRGLTPATINHYMIVLRKILKYSADNRLINSVPNFPKIHGKSSTVTKRDYFEIQEYDHLIKTIEKMDEEGEKVRGVQVTLEFKYLVQFMVNSFIRPSDLRVLKNSHINVMTNSQVKKASDKKFLLLKHPATKTSDKEVVTMPAAQGVYQSLLKLQKPNGFGEAGDFVFFPEYKNRNTMIAVAGRIFSAVIKKARLNREGEKHTLYSLRHTSIMYRLLLGNTTTLELARNARTSEAMIDKHYASRLTPMMAVDSIHSFKSKPSSKKVLNKNIKE